MKMPLLVVIFLALCLASSHASNDIRKRPILIENSRSPDGAEEITITATGEDGDGTGIVRVREVITGRCLDSFRWEGYEDQVSSHSFTVSWRPDSRAFAISYRATRHYTGCEIYVLTRSGLCRQIRFPMFDARSVEKYQLQKVPRGDVDFVKWLPDDRYEILVAGAFADFRAGVLTLRLPTDAGTIELTIEAVRPEVSP